jgi:hypothetical protein
MNTVLAIIADSGRAYYFLLKSIDFTKTLRWRPRPTPCEEAPGAPRLRWHGDSQTVVFFLPKLRPAIFTAGKFVRWA